LTTLYMTKVMECLKLSIFTENKLLWVEGGYRVDWSGRERIMKVVFKRMVTKVWWELKEFEAKSIREVKETGDW
jgi:hypothetical protein